MARVPLQQTPEVGLEIGSAPQFTGGRIEPVQDTVTDDIQRFSKAQQNVQLPPRRYCKQQDTQRCFCV